MRINEAFDEKFGIRSKFIILYVAIVIFLLAMTGFIYFKTTNTVMYNIVTSDTVDLLRKNNQIIDQRLGLINEYTNGLMVDKDLSAYLNTYYNSQDINDVYGLDRPISELLKKYFLYTSDIFSTNLITKKTVYGQAAYPNIIPVDTFAGSEVYHMASDAAGKTVWVPTYDFYKMFSQYMPSGEATYTRVFSAAKMIRLFDNDYAVLVINLSEDMYQKVFSYSNAFHDGQYLVISPDKTIVSHSDRKLSGTKIDTPWLDTAFKNGTGFETIEVDGKKCIVCYDVSRTTGWVSAVIIEQKVLIEQYVKDITRNLLLILAVLIIIPMFVIMLISKTILWPMDALKRGMKESGKGRFDYEVPETGTKEIRMLIRRFNIMNSRISQLIRENYEMIIMKKEAELKSYNLQLNPHFISNSLNLINLELIKSKQYDLSDMVVELTQMMDYTLKTTSFMVPFRKDWEHTHNYIKVMQRRYKDKIEFEHNIQEELFNYSVPKFFLQPLIENSLVHGFENIDYKGVIKVTAYIENGHRVFIVEDNGKGIDEYTRNVIFNDENKSIGINNIRYRIKYVYGDDYEITIKSEPYVSTVITIVLPMGE